MPQRLLNKVAVVTGADGELGRAIVERFLSEGAKVVAFGNDRARLDELTARAAARVLAVEGDVTRGADLEGLAATVARRFGGVDMLVPAAEIRRHASLAESTPEVVSEIFAVNLQGTLETLRVFRAALECRGVDRAGVGRLAANAPPGARAVSRQQGRAGVARPGARRRGLAPSHSHQLRGACDGGEFELWSRGGDRPVSGK